MDISNLSMPILEKKEYILYSLDVNGNTEYVKNVTVSSYRHPASLVKPSYDFQPRLNITWTKERHLAERVSLEEYIRISNLSDVKLYTFPKIEAAYPEPEYHLPLIWCLRFPNEQI